MAIISNRFTSTVLMASPEFLKNMLGSTANDNPAFQREETVRNELSRNDHLGRSEDGTAKNLQVSTLASNQNLEIDHSCARKRVSFPENTTTETEIKLYKQRFWILTLFSVCSMVNAMQWVQYTVVSDLTMCFYRVDISTVNWTANIFLLLYAPLVFPISWVTEKVGIRNSLLVGSFLQCVGTAIQCAATTPGSFALAMVSQAFGSVAQIFIVALPPDIAATWFGADEISRASAVGVFGNQLGCGLGFIFPPMVLPTNCTEKDLIGRGRKIVAYTLFGSNVLVLLLILLTFSKKPKTPPSLAEANKDSCVKDFKRSLCALLKNFNYVLLVLSYGIIVGTSIAMATILFSIVSPHFPGEDEVIGWMGLLVILSGTIGSIIAGYILDLTHRYKETSVAVFIFSFLFMILFSALLYVEAIWLQFVTISILGFFMTSYLPVGFEFAVEITYPEPEAMSATILIASTTVVGLVFAEIGSYLVETYSDIAANSFFGAMLLLGTIITAAIKCDFRRQEQENTTF